MDYFDDDRKKEFCMLNLNNDTDLSNKIDYLSKEINIIKNKFKFG